MNEEFCSGIIPLSWDDGIEILIVKHCKGNYWGFPKGHCPPNEDPIESAKRELEEETNLQVLEVLPYPILKEEYTFFRGEKEIHKTVHYYLAKVTRDYKIQDEELLEARWVRKEDLLSYFSFEEGKNLVKELNKILKTL